MKTRNNPLVPWVISSDRLVMTAWAFLWDSSILAKMLNGCQREGCCQEDTFSENHCRVIWSLGEAMARKASVAT